MGINHKERLELIPEEIKTLREKIVILNDDIEGLTVENDRTEKEILLIITDEVDVEGKIKFSNELKRKQELSKRLNFHGAYNHINELIKNKVREKQQLEIDLEVMRLRFKASELLFKIETL